MVLVYFRRASLRLREYTHSNLFLALFLANDMEEDVEDPKCVIFLWALGKDWHLQVADFLHQRDKLWARMGFRAMVSRECCEEVRPQHHPGVGGTRLVLPPPFTMHCTHARSWPRSRPTGPGLESDAPSTVGLRGVQRPGAPSLGPPASRHLTVPSVAGPLPTATAPTSPTPCLSYQSALPQTLSGIALPSKLVSQWLKTPWWGASSSSRPPNCNWSQAPTVSTSSRSLHHALDTDTCGVKSSPPAYLLTQALLAAAPTPSPLSYWPQAGRAAQAPCHLLPNVPTLTPAPLINSCL
uniref:Speedy/RINGO cell cycle regulator family member C n=1 Tax=Ursus americanus TaxID=9643 RepID=A0A452QDV1_URSAM